MSATGDREVDRYVDRGSDRPALVQRIHKWRVRRIATDIAPTPRRVLEIGPGEGLLAGELVSRGCSYAGIDLSPGGAQQMRERGFDVVVASVPPFPAGDPCDVIVAVHVIEHMEGPRAVVEFLRESADRLDPGGVIALLYPDARRFGFDFWESDYTHTWPSTARRVAQAATDAGLEVISSSRRCLAVTGLAGDLVWRLSKLLPVKLLERLDPTRRELWYRARLLFVPEVLTLIRRPEET
jgi:SAM-dependent methyltransferase